MAENQLDLNRFVPSVDTLFGSEIQGKDCLWFGNKAPLILGAKNDKASLKSVSPFCASRTLLQENQH